MADNTKADKQGMSNAEDQDRHDITQQSGEPYTDQRGHYSGDSDMQSEDDSTLM